MEIQLFAFWWGGEGTRKKHVERVAGILAVGFI